MSSRASRKAALHELGEDGDDVFDLVESLRQREDFVVDDDGLGYYDDGVGQEEAILIDSDEEERRLADGDFDGDFEDDEDSEKRYDEFDAIMDSEDYDDGEERLGDQDEDIDKKKRSSSATANLTAGALKKARKAKLANQRHDRGEGQGNNDEDDDVVASNRSMWDFVKRGTSASAAASTPKAAPAAVRRNVDDLLVELDNITSSALSTSSRRTKKRPQRRPVVSVPVLRRNPPACASAAASTPNAAPAAVRRNVDDLLGELDNITSSALSTSSSDGEERRLGCSVLYADGDFEDDEDSENVPMSSRASRKAALRELGVF